MLGGPSAVLDVARPRLFSSPLRQVLALRDGGCAFPDCDTPPAGCDAHHLNPWWAGGETTLDNGVLLCPHHHRLIEPDSSTAPGARWAMRLDDYRLPEVIPPADISPGRTPGKTCATPNAGTSSRREADSVFIGVG